MCINQEKGTLNISDLIELDRDYFYRNFFIITPDNCKDINSFFIGYALVDDIFFIRYFDFNKYKLCNNDYGAYVQVLTEENKIKVYQDYHGFFGLYLYTFRNFWALSNSFIYLANFLHSNKHLSFNENFARAFIQSPFLSLGYSETMIKEIRLLPKNSYLDIDILKKTISIKYFYQPVKQLAIDTLKGMELIDMWHQKWNNLARSLSTDNKIQFDLSGGFDTRAALSVLFNERFSFDNIHFYSDNTNVHTLAEDFKIASEIAKIYNFSLNTFELHTNNIKLSAIESLFLVLLIRAGFHKMLNTNNRFFTSPLFKFTGYGGEVLRLYDLRSIEEYINGKCGYINCQFTTVNFRQNLSTIIYNSIADAHGLLNSGQDFFEFIENRIHFGKQTCCNFLFNIICCSPLLDPILNILESTTYDRNLFFAIIFTRYLPELNSLKFDSNHMLSEDAVKYAKYLNNKFPYTFNNNFHEISVVNNTNIFPSALDLNESNLESLIMDIFNSPFFEYRISKLFSSEVYENAINYMSKCVQFPLQEINALLQTDIIANLTSILTEIDNNFEGFQYNNI